MNRHTEITDKAVTQNVGLSFLFELIQQARNGNHISLEQWGIDSKVFNDISSMSISELHEIADNDFISIKVKPRSLNILTQKIIKSRDIEHLLNEAIIGGASREIMREYAGMSPKEFKSRREKLQVTESRYRPAQLDKDDYDRVSYEHSRYGKHNSIIHKIDHLKCLIHLYKQTHIQINQIYKSYYQENDNLFMG